MRLISQELLFRSPGLGSLVYGHSFYTRPAGIEKMVRRSIETKNDLIDCFDEAWSDDNGKTWGPFRPRPALEQTPEGTRRTFVVPSFVDPHTGRLVTVYNQGLLPSDDALVDGIKRFHLRYSVSDDGGRSSTLDEQVIQSPVSPGDPAAANTADRPLRGVVVGRNSAMTGDGNACVTRAGRILVPIQLTRLGPDGELYNPLGAYTYHDAAVLRGDWTRDGRIAWDLSEEVRLELSRSTRGCIEPTVAQLPGRDDRLLMVLRGSNENRPEMPGYKWFCTSEDEGRTWSPPEPWGYAEEDGRPFFSPSATSQLLAHSSGRLFWIGNITPDNPRGNRPRYPVVIGEVDPGSLRLRRDSLTVVDDRGAGESEGLSLSNFFAHEDRVTGEIVVHLSRWMMPAWIGDAYVFRVGV